MLARPTRPMAAALALLLVPLAAAADGVRVRHEGADPSTTPFPSDRFTVRDWTQNTFRRVNLPLPDCAVRVSDCADIAVVNTLDGFSTQPRITVPFTGNIDPATVSSDTVFLVNLGDTLTLAGFGHKVGINQIVWDPATKVLAFESDELLAQHSRYLLVVTDGVRDTSGRRIKAALHDDDGEHARELRDALRLRHSSRHHVVSATLFTTQSITADLQKIGGQIDAATPAAADFLIGASAAGPVRAVFPAAGITGIRFDRQTGTAPAFTPSFLPTLALGVVPGAVGQIAYGRYRSPDYETADRYIPATGTLTGQPQVQGHHDLTFQLFVPAGPKPPSGWPVAIFGHGFGDSIYGAPWTVGSVFASRGLATIAVNVVGHGGGPLGTLTVLPAAGAPVVIPAGGRGIDQDGNGSIDSTEGSSAAPPRTIIGNRDGLRQTVIDLMQLVRVLQGGMDVDGDGSADLSTQRLYYTGQSFGGIYGSIFLGVESDIRAGVANVAGGSITEVARLGVFRALIGLALLGRVPSLFNVQSNDPTAFIEAMPLRNLPPLVNTVPGAMAIAEVLDRFEWVQQAGNPVSYAPHIRKQPLPGHAAKPVLFQFAKGDKTVPNPTTTAILRAGDLADRAVFFRNDLAYAIDPAVGKNPHAFLTNIGNPAAAPYAVGAQTQTAAFFATDGTTVIDPDGAGPIFEVPIVPPLPEQLFFIP
ncbi:Ig-like domain-containing protein [Piscinibacter sp. XHJ-5]|uniref:Ig-like domain-containing protein n=1 Tax=Piscinibacter sp. XHJ-5 TaxID=3037797 RepID=UPI0024535962|nr:Ig-like domain-containing protein [Piscinibacter sp. XHJ-5]